MEFDFTWHKLAWLVVAIIAIFAFRWGYLITPQVRATADKIVQLNNLQGVDLKIGGCIPIKGSL
jgi:hypothetical protein